LSQTAEHDERIAGPAAQALRPREQIHELGIVRTPLLRGAPGQVMEGLEIAPAGSLDRSLAACTSVGALSGLGEREEQNGE
jgi:hypothetical protein